jgi:hypothetical protein
MQQLVVTSKITNVHDQHRAIARHRAGAHDKASTKTAANFRLFMIIFLVTSVGPERENYLPLGAVNPIIERAISYMVDTPETFEFAIDGQSFDACRVNFGRGAVSCSAFLVQKEPFGL